MNDFDSREAWIEELSSRLEERATKSWAAVKEALGTEADLIAADSKRLRKLAGEDPSLLDACNKIDAICYRIDAEAAAVFGIYADLIKACARLSPFEGVAVFSLDAEDMDFCEDGCTCFACSLERSTDLEDFPKLRQILNAMWAATDPDEARKYGVAWDAEYLRAQDEIGGSGTADGALQKMYNEMIEIVHREEGVDLRWCKPNCTCELCTELNSLDFPEGW